MTNNYKHLYYFAVSLILPLIIVSGIILTDYGLNFKVLSKSLDEHNSDTQIYFEENKGQFDKKVNFFARGTKGFNLFLTSTEAVYVISDTFSKSDITTSKIKALSNPQTNTEAQKQKAVAVYMTLNGANQTAGFNGLQLLEHQTNYFKGSDESKWQTTIPNYQSVRANQIYNGIDVIWHGQKSGGVQADFVAHPNADLSQIEWSIEGAKNVEITATGDLLIKTKYGDIKQLKPRLYQESNNLLTEVGSKFIVSKAKSGTLPTVKIEADDFQAETETIETKVLTGELAFSTFLGGSGAEFGNSVAIDNIGNTYITGSSNSILFPTTPGTFDPSINGSEDVFVTKLNASGSALIYSTFIGGGGLDQAFAIKVDSSGNAYVTGRTFDAMTDYPTTVGVFNPNHNGTYDAFVTKLNPAGSALIYSTFIGGGNDEQGFGIAVDSLGSAYITGLTRENASGSLFPTTIGAFDTTQNGSEDAFVSKFNPSGSALVYSTFIGGNNTDFAGGIAIDTAGNAYLTGRTNSTLTPLPTTVGAFDTSQNGNYDAFVTKLNAAGSALVYSTFLGGDNDDSGYSISIDSSQNTFLTGFTRSTGFPTTLGSYDTAQNGNADVFVTKVNSTGSILMYSTFLGGSETDIGYGIFNDASGNAYISGLTVDADINFPTTSGAFDTTHNGGGDVFVSKINSAGSSLLYSTFLGGNDYDVAFGLTADTFGNVFLTGQTYNATTNYPITSGAFDTTNNGAIDVFVTKLQIPQSRNGVFDFDGDGKTDISIFRPTLGQWWYLRSSDNTNRAFQFGSSTDNIVPADYTGDGKTDIATFKPTTGFWNILRSEDSTFYGFPFGTNGDIAAPADYDGDGRADAAVFRTSNSTWYISKSSGGTTIQQFGAAGDKPTVADYDGDGKADLAIYRVALGQWWYLRSSDGTNRAFTFGTSTDKPLQGDYTGDGKADLAFFRPSTGEWFVLRSEDSTFYGFPFGTSGDIPASGDYDGDGRFDAAVFRPTNTTWFINRSTAGTQIVGFGANGDLPVPNAFVP